MTYRHFALLLTCLLVLSACTSKHYRRSADKEVGKIISQKTKLVPNMDTNFTIEATNKITLTNLEIFDKSEVAFGEESDMEKGSRVLMLNEALDIAIKHSNEYLSRKEDLYRSALTLTYARYVYTPIFTSVVDGTDSHQIIDVNDTVTKTRIDPTTGQPFLDANGNPETYTETVTKTKDNHQVYVKGSVSVDTLLRTGGKISANFTTDFLQFIGGSSPNVASSTLSGTLTQPLLRGAGYAIAIENLTQAERNMLYDLRDFTRYRKQFSVDIASDYYNVLQSRDAVRNNWRGLQNYRQNVLRERAYFEADRRSQASVDQLKQAELQIESDWVSAVRNYRQALDSFKVRIGLHTDDRVILDDRELEQLKIVHPSLTMEEAVNVAMVNRLDLDTQREQLQDARRHIKVAANALLPQLDLTANAAVQRVSGSALPVPDWQHYGWSTGLELDLPLNRISERNNYRSSIIDLERARRGFDYAVDNIKLQIAADWRNLDQAKRNYEIREIGVQIASRRVEEQRIRQEIGEGNSRDLVDAQSALIDSENQRTAALVGHTIARLSIYRDMGVLWIKDNGQWDENPPKHERKNS